MIIDSFTFFNELDMLEFRLEELNDYVDYFVLVEATKTFSGNPKPLYFEQNKQRYSKFLHKIVHVKVDDLPSDIDEHTSSEKFLDLLGNPVWPNLDEFNSLRVVSTNNNGGGGSINHWVREYIQRAKIYEGIIKLTPKDTDIIITSDVDEIINTEYLSSLLEESNRFSILGKTDKIYKILHRAYYYNLECVYNHWSDKIIICNYGKLKEIGNINSMRWMSPIQAIGPGGWHFSYFGSIEWMQEKIKSFSHQEYNRQEYTDSNKLQDRIRNNLDLFDRDGGRKGEIYSYTPFDSNDSWPKKINLLKQLFNI